MATVPANPGFHVRAFYSNGEKFKELSAPVIAWEGRAPVVPGTFETIRHFDNVRFALVAKALFFDCLHVPTEEPEQFVIDGITTGERANEYHKKAKALFASRDDGPRGKAPAGSALDLDDDEL